MYKLCKTEQSAQRQRELERGLLAAMGTRQYEEISVSDLCDQLGIPRKSFYRYFSSKDGALHALIDHTLLDYEAFPGTPKPGEKRTYQKDLERFFLFWKEQKPLLDALVRSEISGVLVTRSIHHALSSAGTPTRFLQQEEKVARENATTFGICGLMSIVLSWHQGGYQIPVRQMAESVVQLLTKPLFSEADAY
nr:TetR/AcrR family transcriptional regulator [Oscillospiraceae bacterium]